MSNTVKVVDYISPISHTYKLSKDFARAIVRLSDYISCNGHLFLLPPGLDWNANDVLTLYQKYNMDILGQWRYLSRLYNITSYNNHYAVETKKYIALLRTDSSKILVQFDTLEFLNGICSLLLWANKRNNMIELVDTTSLTQYRVNMIGNDNEILTRNRNTFIKLSLLDVDIPNDLIGIISTYIVGTCDNDNSVIKCCNSHENTESISNPKLLCDNCLGNYNRLPMSTVELIQF
jgi:hypothetical protein